MSVVDRLRESEDFSRAADAVGRAVRTGADYVLEHAPVVGRQALRKRARVVLAPYRRTDTWGVVIWKAAAVPLTVFFCLLYGFFFGLTAPWLMVPFLIPIGFVMALIIWALPDQRSAPTAPIEYLMPAFFICMILWPEYLAISLPGMPWITMMRIIGLPIGILFLVSLSVSRDFRKLVGESVSAIKPTWVFLCCFILVQIFTTFLSAHAFGSLQVVFNCQIYWTLMFCVGSILFRDLKQIERYWALFCAMGVPIVILAFYEWPRQHIPWAAHIPAFLRVPDPSVKIVLTPSFRPGINYYRIKGTFFSPLALSEYLSLLTPMFLYFGFSFKNIFLRLGCFAMLPLMFVTIRFTDARLGVVGMFSSLLLYGMLWSIVRWRSHPRDLFAAATVYGYPAVFAAGFSLIFVSHRFKLMLLGDGAQASSTDARATQFDMAMRAAKHAPWGYGTGQSGAAMGFSASQFVTIDNYFITILLDYGVLGVLFWYGMFICAILTSLRYCMSPVYGARREAKLLAPLVVSLTSFLIIKWVHGQADNHAVYFLMLGMVSALVYRLKTVAVPAAEAAAEAAGGARGRRERKVRSPRGGLVPVNG